MNSSRWLCHIGYSTLRGWRGFCCALTFLGTVWLAIWHILKHPAQISFNTLIHKLYYYGPRNLVLTLFSSIFCTAIITAVSGYQLSFFGAVTQVSKIHNLIMPTLLSPILVNLITLYRSIYVTKQNLLFENYRQDSPKIIAHLLAVPVSVTLLYVWFFAASLMVNYYLTPYFGVSRVRYFQEILSGFEINVFYIGLFNSFIISIALALVLLFYQYRTRKNKMKSLMNMIFYGTIIVAVMQALLRFLLG